MRTKTYTTDLPEDECLKRLQKHVHRGGWVPWVEGTIRARIRGHRFRLFACGRENIANSFAPFFYGRLETGIDGTRIRGRFQMHPLVRSFLAVWFGGLLWMAALLLFLPDSSWGGAPPLLAALGPVTMILIGVGLLAINRRYVQRQVDGIARFLEEQLETQLKHVGGPNQDVAPNGGPATSLGNSRGPGGDR